MSSNRTTPIKSKTKTPRQFTPKSKKKSSRSSSTTPTPSKKSKKNSFNNITHSELRVKFYEVLDDETHVEYIRTMIRIALLLESKIKNTVLKYKKFNFKFNTSIDDHIMEIFGGSVFFILFLESNSLGLFSPEDINFFSNFLEYKTIDIDASINYDIEPNIEEYSEKRIKLIINDFSKQYQELLLEKFEEILTENPDISEFLSFLAKEKGLKGFDLFKKGSTIPHIGPDGIFSLSVIKNYDEVQEIRPQFNTCVNTDKYCDHILEILTRRDGNLKNVRPYDLSVVPKFLGRNILLLCMDNIDRIYRDCEQFIDGKLNDKKAIIAIKKVFKTDPAFKTKYMQGFYRVQLTHFILSNLIEKKSPKFNKLKEIFEGDKDIFKRISNSITKNKLIISILSTRERSEVFQYFTALKVNTDYNSLNKMEEIIRKLIDLWLLIHEKILKQFSRDNVGLTEYSLPPSYSSNNNENNRLYVRVGNEMGIDFENPDWETNTKSSVLIKLLKRLGLKPLPITAGTRTIVIKKIKEKLNLT